MAMSSSCGTSNLAAADRNSLLKAVLEWARTRPLALPSKTAPASPVPLNLRKSRRCMLEFILEDGFTSSCVVLEHSEHTFPLLPWLGPRMLPTAERLHKSKASTGDKGRLLELPCTSRGVTKRCIATRTRNYYMQHRGYISAPPTSCGRPSVLVRSSSQYLVLGNRGYAESRMGTSQNLPSTHSGE